mmetsp:Transcript_18914/g.54785  ORF Transcript_18914/g.54785 Transcript_18914/m.54785 type:complete len:289 (+) Transcript_18914:1276-2142(+)
MAFRASWTRRPSGSRSSYRRTLPFASTPTTSPYLPGSRNPSPSGARCSRRGRGTFSTSPTPSPYASSSGPRSLPTARRTRSPEPASARFATTHRRCALTVSSPSPAASRITSSSLRETATRVYTTRPAPRGTEGCGPSRSKFAPRRCTASPSSGSPPTGTTKTTPVSKRLAMSMPMPTPTAARPPADRRHLSRPTSSLSRSGTGTGSRRRRRPPLPRGPQSLAYPAITAMRARNASAPALSVSPPTLRPSLRPSPTSPAILSSSFCHQTGLSLGRSSPFPRGLSSSMP